MTNNWVGGTIKLRYIGKDGEMMAKGKNIARLKRTITYSKKKAPKVKKQAQLVNQMIKNLGTKKSASYAVETLFSKLSDVKDVKKLVNKQKMLINVKNLANLKPTSIRAISKALVDFQRSESATRAGLRKIANRQRKTLLKMTGNEDFVNSLSDKEISNFHKMFEDINYSKATSGLDSMSAYTIMTDAKSSDLTEEQFIEYMELYINESPDKGQADAIKKIYNKYIKNKG